MNYRILLLLSVFILAGCDSVDWGVNKVEKEALFQAIDDGDVNNIKLLIDNNSSLIHTKDEFGFTALMAAVSSSERNILIISKILDAGGDVNEKTSEGYTALHMMVDVNGPSGTGHLPYEIALLLVSKGADTEIKQHWGWTPLMRAALEGTDDEFIAILETGAQTDVQYSRKSLPEFTRGMDLMQVVISEPKKVEALINFGYKISPTHIQEAKSRIAEVEKENGEKFDKKWQDSYISSLNKSIILLENDLTKKSSGGKKTPR